MTRSLRIGAGLAVAATVLWPLLTTGSVAAGLNESATELGQLRDITGIEEIAPVGEGKWLTVALLAGLAAAAGAGLAVWHVRRRPPRMTPAPADQWAIAELDKVISQDGPESEQVALTQVSEIIRRYLELRYGLSATWQSTEELLGSLRCKQQPRVDEMLRTVLARCDLAKFASAGYSADERRACAEMARSFVIQSREGAVSAS